MSKPHWDVLADILPLTLQEDTRGVMALSDTGQVYGGVVCEDWTETLCCCHIVLADPFRAMRAGLIDAVADYVFTQCGRLKMIGMVPGDNLKAQKLNKHIGFTELYRIEDGYKQGIDYVVMELKRENCPYWAGEEDGKEEHARAA